MLVLADESQARKRIFEDHAGTWKATCDEHDGGKVYCRMFHIEKLTESHGKNFLQFGPAWTPDAVGFVVATFMGFQQGTTVRIGVDKFPRRDFTAPKDNSLMTAPDVAKEILAEMVKGHKQVVMFQTRTGARHLALVELGPFNELLVKVKQQMAKNKQSSAPLK
uniref:Uncharacterized protein n=1 Tax=Magnetococcus massalia (strain MO-1) TaxID=451514 RepID=A0A1S7LFZ6_MAGMO|nr:protein of unknown function [Candidatus Magnetococcus massalia]